MGNTLERPIDEDASGQASYVDLFSTLTALCVVRHVLITGMATLNKDELARINVVERLYSCA